MKVKSIKKYIQTYLQVKTGLKYAGLGAWDINDGTAGRDFVKSSTNPKEQSKWSSRMGTWQ